MQEPNSISANDRASPRKSDAQRQQSLDAVRSKRARPTTRMRIATLNIGTLTGKSRELSAIMTHRNIDILCIQETKWTGGKSGGTAWDIGDGCKLYYAGGKRPRNGVGICLSSGWQESVVSVVRTSDRVVSLKLLTPGKTYNIISVYAPQQGCDPEEKERFWNQLEEVMDGVPSTEEMVVAGDLNGHVGQDRGVFERWHGGKTLGPRNEDGERILKMAQTYDMALVNTFFMQEKEKMITYKSGGHETVIDYINVRRGQLGRVRNCKVIPGEAVATQHRLLVCDIDVPRIKKKVRKRRRKIKWWKLREEEGRRYLEGVGKLVEQMVVEDRLTWKDTHNKVIEMAREELGESRGGKYLEKESWFWNPEVEEKVAAKKGAFKQWQRTRSDEDRAIYRTANKEASRAVAIAKEGGYEELYRDLEKNGPKRIYKLAKTRTRRAQDIDRLVFVKDSQDKVLTEDVDIRKRWRQYFEVLLNTKNNRKELEEVAKTEGPIPEVSIDEVKQQLNKMANNKATGPDKLPIEVFKLLEHAGAKWMTSMLAEIQRSGIPKIWRCSTIAPLYKQKGDPLNCNNYRGIKLLSHSLKLWERVIESRLREIVEISERQYGFQKGKSTTQPMFCLRILQEKYREFNKSLHLVFVDLEKAYDTVPRDLIWYCLRKRAVPEAYVCIIQDMYRACKTRVTTVAGETEDIDIEVGLHQGSALSPFLFIIIMDVITEEIEEQTPWAMLFADDLVLCDGNAQDVERRLERWRRCLEDGGLKISRTKTEHLVPAGDPVKICLKEYSTDTHTELPRTSSFRYLGTTIHQDGGCKAEVERRVSKAWDRWRSLTGVLCDRKVPTRLKMLLYKVCIRPTLLYGNELWPLTQRLEDRISSTEMRMLRYIHGISLEEHRRNVEIRELAGVEAISVLMRKRRLQWYGHVCRRKDGEDIQRVTHIRVDGKRSRGRPKHRWMDTIKSDMKLWGLEREDTDDRERWRALMELGALQKPATLTD